MTKAQPYRLHGTKPYISVGIHGGPGASGSLYDLCEEVGKRVGIIELLNHSDSIDGQIGELNDVIRGISREPVTLIGHSWGAWLSVYYENAYPQTVKQMILISPGPFDAAYVQEIEKTRKSRMSRKTKERLSEHFVKINEEDEMIANTHFERAGQIISKLDSYDVLERDLTDKTKCDMQIYQRVWTEASQKRKNGQLIKSVKQVKCPMIIIHGDHDPHPVEGIKSPLLKEGIKAKCFVLSKCGHYPWREKHAKDDFYQILENLLID
ncbi:MAG TPA: alpha/beta hydrolase [Thermotogota bacterium]|nr:alpha/beta hydrolase [Thermotogota bacterium]HRW34732.1 alpha/beta hydrolase [Thermotogota bacterium]